MSIIQRASPDTDASNGVLRQPQGIDTKRGWFTKKRLGALGGVAVVGLGGLVAVMMDQDSKPNTPAPIETSYDIEGDPAASLGDALTSTANISAGQIIDRASTKDVTPYSTPTEFGYKIPRKGSAHGLTDRATIGVTNSGELLISTNTAVGSQREVINRFAMPLTPESAKHFNGKPLTPVQIKNVVDSLKSEPGNPVKFTCVEKDSVDNPNAHQGTVIEAIYIFDKSGQAFVQHSQGGVVVSSETVDTAKEAGDAVKEAIGCVSIP